MKPVRTAFIFPGQGSQNVGMGADLYQNFSTFKNVFDEVSEAVHRDIVRVAFEGPADELNKTENAQVALMAMSVGIFRTLKNEFGGALSVDFVAGHSLGEYSALVCAGAFALADMAVFLEHRGRAMMSAFPDGVGGMAVVLGLTKDAVQKIVDGATLSGDDMCAIANDNCPGQIVISGHVTALARAEELAKSVGARRFMRLPVGVPTHCILMRKSIDVLQPEMDAMKFSNPVIPFVSNNSVQEERDEARIKHQLMQQMIFGVRWTECVQYMMAQGVGRFIEIGAGNVLTGLIKKIADGNDEIKIETINNVEGVKNYVQS